MTTFNGENYLKEQLNSILNQTYSNFELIICDDCSFDSTCNILQEYKNKDKRIQFFRNNKNIGFKNNFEKAISLCSGDYIALSDQDDIWSNDHLEVLLNNIKGYSLICSQSEFIDSNGKKINNFFLDGDLIKKFHKVKTMGDRFYFILIRNIVQGCTILFQKTIVDRLIPIPDPFQYHDWWFALIASFFYKIDVINVVTVYYRIHEQNASRVISTHTNRKQKRNNYFYSIYNRISIFSNYFRKIFNEDQARLCESIIKYYSATINRENYLFRFFFYIKHYSIQYLDEHFFKSIFLFLPRILFRIFLSPKLRYE
jgi:glycosyltransferase involved in cell wall biosynthesis